MGTKKPKNILIAPLDWGLGHTTRCVPLIHYLQHTGHNPIFAGNASQRSFIGETFGDTINSVHLDGYNITYSKWNRVAQMGLLSQFPAISSAIAHEQEWLLQNTAKLALDGIISDNRYGLFHSRLPTVIIIHQPRVLSGFGNLADRTVQRLHYKYLNRFGVTWIPDNDGAPNIGGILSHPGNLPLISRYIGPLSRFNEHTASQPIHTAGAVVILLSGPEPQRSELAARLWKQAVDMKSQIVFVEGNETVAPPAMIPDHIDHYKRVTQEQLGPILADASMVVCRSGYSTIMDLLALGKKAILIPTPGQTEQQYLAGHLHKQGIYYSVEQERFNLEEALTEAGKFPYHKMELASCYSQYKAAVSSWVESL